MCDVNYLIDKFFKFEGILWECTFFSHPNALSNLELQGRILTGATLSLLIGGGAYASTVDEATFW